MRSRPPLELSRASLGHWLFASALLHGLIAAWWLQQPFSATPLLAPTAPPVPVQVVVHTPPAPVAPVVPDPPAVEPPPPPVAPPPPKPKPRPVAKPTPAPEPVPQPPPVESSEAPPTEVAAAPLPAVSAAPPALPGPSMDDLLARYKQMLLERIAANKRYPAMARRRGIEGDVRVRLRIDATGALADVETVGRSPLVLSKQARKAATKAAPFPPPPGGDLAIDFVLRFDLSD